MIILGVRFSVIGRCPYRALVAVNGIKKEETLYFVGDLARAQFAFAAPFVEESQEHAIWSKFVLLT